MGTTAPDKKQWWMGKRAFTQVLYLSKIYLVIYTQLEDTFYSTTFIWYLWLVVILRIRTMKSMSIQTKMHVLLNCYCININNLLVSFVTTTEPTLTFRGGYFKFYTSVHFVGNSFT